MRRNTAHPNRVLFDHYKLWGASRPGVEFFVRHLVGSERDFNGTPLGEVPADEMDRATSLIEAERDNFTPSLREVAAEDLAISAFILVLHKEEAQSLR